MPRRASNWPDKARPLKKELEQIDKRLATLAAERAELETRLTQPLPLRKLPTAANGSSKGRTKRKSWKSGGWRFLRP